MHLVSSEYVLGLWDVESCRMEVFDRFVHRKGSLSRLGQLQVSVHTELGHLLQEEINQMVASQLKETSGMPCHYLFCAALTVERVERTARTTR